MASVARKDAKRFSSLNLGTTYKGAKPEAKGAGSKGGFQSLGKIQGKRMPGPAQLPSLRKENAGNDPNVNLVPQAGGGWGTGKEDELENKETSNQPSTQPVIQPQDPQPAAQQLTTGREASVKKEGIWATPEINSVGPPNHPPNQQFKKNFPSLEEREARATKRTIPNELHHDTGQVPFSELDNMSNVPAAVPPAHYHYPPRPRPPYPAGPSHMGPPYLPRGMPPFRHGMPPPGAEYNHYGHHGGPYRGYPPQQQPGPPSNSAAGGQYQYPVPRYPLPLAHNMDPYQDGQSKLVKSEELKNLELPDEDDDVGGWAGYHEEVDYSKKVVFNDSSDDEERESHQEHQQRQPKRKEIHERESTSRETRMQEAPPLATVEQPHLHTEQSSKHLHTTPAELQYFQHPHTGGHYPLYYTTHPQRGYPMPVASRPVEKERPHQLPQSDLQPIWQQQNRRGPKGVPPPESAWGEDKLLTPPAVIQSSSAVQSIPNEQLETIQQQLEQTTLNDSDSNVTAISAEKKHVTFHLEQQEQQPVAPPAARQPLKIMMRDMKLSTRDEHDQTSTTEIFHHSNTGKPPYHLRPNDTDHQHAVNIDKSLPQQQKVSAWKAADRGPITTPRTLYEPEGDKSAKKFNALIKQTSSERGKRSSISDSTQDGEQVQSPSGDIKILKPEEKQLKGKQSTAITPPDEATATHNKSQQASGKNKTAETSTTTTTKKSSKRERPSVRQYQPPPAREQDEQAYSESKGSGRRPFRQDYNYEQQQGDNRGQRRRDRQPSDGRHQSEGKHHAEGKYQSEKKYSYDSKHQAEGKPHSEGKAPSEGKHHPEGKRQHVDNSSRRDNRYRKERETSKEPPGSTHEQTEQLAPAEADASKEDASKPEHLQEDKTKQSGKDTHSKGGSTSGETKHKKKSTTSSSVAQKSDTSAPKEKSRGRGGRHRGSNNDDWYYSDDYYNQWYAAGGYDDYYYYYDDYNYYPERRAPSGRQKQQQQSYDSIGKSTSERRDNGSKKSQQQSDRGANRPARTRGGDKKDEPSDDKGQQHRATKDKSREVSGEEVSRSKPAEEADTRDRSRRRDNKQYQESNVDKRRSSRTSGSKGTVPQSSTTGTSKSSASHDPTGRGQSRSTSSNKTTSGTQDRTQQSEDQQHTAAGETSSGKKEPAIKDKAASAKMANVDINSPTVFVIDEEQTAPLSSTAAENDDFIRVTSKKEKREMKELEKHRQQEKQRKAEEEENKKKQHSTRKSSQKTKHQQQQHQLQEQSLPHEDQSLSTSWNTTTTAPAVTNNASIWTESITNLLNEGVNQTSYIAAAHSSLMPSGDYQLFPTSSYTSSSAPLAHLSAAVDSSVAQDLPTSAPQGHSLSETDVKPTGVGRPDASSAGHGAIRTDLPLSKSHSSASVGGAIGRGRGSSSSRAPGSNRGSSSSRDSSRKLPPSSSDSKLSSSTSPKISKPSTAVRSKPSTNSLSSSDKVTQSSAIVTTTMAATGRKKMSGEASVTRPPQEVGGSKRAGSHSAGGHAKSNKQRSSKLPSAQRQQPLQQQPQLASGQSPSSSNVSTVSYANAVKSSPSLQDKKTTTVNKPVAYVKPTASNVAAPAAPSLSVPEQQEDISTSVEPLSRMPSFPTAHLSQELMAEEDPVIMASTEEKPKQVKVTKTEATVVVPPPAFVSPVVSKSSSPAASAAAPVSKSSRLTFVPFTFVATPSTSSNVTSHQANIVKVTTETSAVTSHPEQCTENGKEGIVEVEEVASKRIRLGPVATVQRAHTTDHSTKLNIAAVPFIPSSVPAAAGHQKSTTITSHATNVTTSPVVATPSHKVSMPTACYPLPTATMMPTNIMPVIMPHPQMGSGYALSQQAAYPSVFPTAVPSHTYPMPTHPHSIVGLAYPGYPMQQPPTMIPSAVTNNSVPPGGIPSGGAPNYNMYVPQPVTASNVIPPPPAAPFPPAAVAAHHARIEQRKKEEQLKALSDTKRFYEQTAASSITKQQPQLYKYPATMAIIPVKQQLPVTTESGRRTLLENPPVPMAMPRPPVASMMNRPLELTAANGSPSTGSKRKRRPPLMPLPQIPAANNVTMTTTTPWDKPTNTLY